MQRMPISNKQWGFLCYSLARTEGQMMLDLGLSAIPRTLSATAALLLDRLCQEYVNLPLSSLISLSEFVMDWHEVSRSLGFSLSFTYTLMERFAEHNKVVCKCPVLIWSNQLSLLVDDGALARHIAKNPIWHWRQTNRIAINSAAKMLQLSPLRIKRLEAGVEMPCPDDLKKLKSVIPESVIRGYSYWVKRNKILQLKLK